VNAISGVSVAVREKRGHARAIEASASAAGERRARGERGGWGGRERVGW
jgi:hypothetical protein